jgi:uncharacterized protein (TIGR03435 family)
MGELSLVAKATSILVVALLATRLIHRIAASTRALIVTAAFGVLLVLPAMELVLPARPVAVQLPRIASGADAAVPQITTKSESIRGMGNSRVGAAVVPPSRLPRAATLVRLAWGIGMLLVLIRLGVGLGRLRTLRNTGEPWANSMATAILRQSTSRRVYLFLHSGLNAPMTCGIVRPAIGLPIDARDWSAAELQQALIHEVEHIRRADWLVQVLARVACGLYWFHPLAWLAARRLHLECEHACDDAVVRVSGPASYAQQLVSIARRLSEGVSRPALSMADRRDLSKRVDAVLNRKRPRTQLRPAAVATTSIAALLITAAIAPWRPAAAQSGRSVEDVLPIPAGLTGKRFEDVSIQSGDAAHDASATFDSRTGAFVARNTSLFWLISHAYASFPELEFIGGEPYELQDQRIKGGPEWIHTEAFNIDARAKHPVTAADLRMMLRQMLRDSFDLAVRVETQETPAYRIVPVGRAGASAPGLQPGNQSCADRWNMEGGGPGHVVRRCITMAGLAADFTLAEVLGRPLIDRTGISGVFNVSLVYSPTRDELSTIYELSASDLPREFFDRPSIFAAMEQQLGLRLESTRGTIHSLAIESAVRPRQIP